MIMQTKKLAANKLTSSFFKDGQPDTSWLSGKYLNIDAEINTKIPYIGIGEYFWQGEEADTVINEIHQIWVNGDMTTEEAVEKYALSLP